jgi:hypothetical protein
MGVIDLLRGLTIRKLPQGIGKQLKSILTSIGVYRAQQSDLSVWPTVSVFDLLVPSTPGTASD